MDKRGIERVVLIGFIVALLIIAGFFIAYYALMKKDFSIIEFIKNLLRFGR